jgi:hypothetical protein
MLSCTKVVNEMFLAQTKSKTTSPRFIEYIIHKGNHYAEGTSFKEVHQSELRFEVLFDSSAIYTNSKATNQYDINKLYGFSDCGTMHHENSARFGWRWNGKCIEIHAYWYNDSIRHNEFLDTVSIGTATALAIKALPRHYSFEIKNRTHSFPRRCNTSAIEGYQLYPYFGGDETAPHDIRIRIKEF